VSRSDNRSLVSTPTELPVGRLSERALGSCGAAVTGISLERGWCGGRHFVS
jgi:hypothetical protein